MRPGIFPARDSIPRGWRGRLVGHGRWVEEGALYCGDVQGTVSFTVAGLRVTPTPWEKQSNFSLLERFARQAVDEGAQVVVTPEGFLEGYVWNDENPQYFSKERYFEIGEPADGPLLRRVGALASELQIYLAVGVAERRGQRMYNSMFIYSPDGVAVSHYAKTHTAGDEPYNTKGSEFPLVETALGCWGTLICMDRQLPETSRILALKGAQLILVPAWGMYGEINDIMMRTRAFENGVHVLFVHPKRCLIISPDGTIIAQDQGNGDEVVTAQVTLCPSGTYGPIRRRRPEIYGELMLSSPGKDQMDSIKEGPS
jgi:deaminated glutathione amidase